MSQKDVHLDAIWLKTMCSHVKMKVRKGQPGMDPWILSARVYIVACTLSPKQYSFYAKPHAKLEDDDFLALQRILDPTMPAPLKRLSSRSSSAAPSVEDGAHAHDVLHMCFYQKYV